MMSMRIDVDGYNDDHDDCDDDDDSNDYDDRNNDDEDVQQKAANLQPPVMSSSLHSTFLLSSCEDSHEIEDHDDNMIFTI